MDQASKKKLIVLSDNDKLARALELNLQGGWQVIRRPTSLPAPPPACAPDMDLVVVVASSPTSEPAVMLARAALTDCIGVIPILIISERAFPDDPETRISHLDFPFSVDMLNKAVEMFPRRGPVDLDREGLGDPAGRQARTLPG